MTKEQEPAWVQAKVDQRIAFMRDVMGHLGWALVKSQQALLMTPLTEPNENATQAEMDAWEHSCDNCGKPSKGDLWTGSVSRSVDGVQVVITFGACGRCAGKRP